MCQSFLAVIRNPSKALTTSGSSMSLHSRPFSVESIISSPGQFGCSLARRARDTAGSACMSSLEGRSNRGSEGRGTEVLLRQAQTYSLEGHRRGRGRVESWNGNLCRR
jgi:hypothetical protein